MRKLCNVIAVVGMSVLLASCGSDNATSSGSSSSAGTYVSSCQSVVDYVNDYDYKYFKTIFSPYYGSYVQYYSYEEVVVGYKQYEYSLETQSVQSCLVGKYLCGEFTYSNTAATQVDSDVITVSKGSRDSILLSILDEAESCKQVATHIYEVNVDDTTYHFNVSIPQEANPVRIIEQYDDERTDYYVYSWMLDEMYEL